jgi:hypothetical protein
LTNVLAIVGMNDCPSVKDDTVTDGMLELAGPRAVWDFSCGF